MRESISEMAKRTGVSVRTLHYYDEIGLLKPSEIATDTGYRYYHDEALERLQQILFFRELNFSLKEIQKIMSSSDYTKEVALQKQRELLCLEKERLEGIIQLLDARLKGEHKMSFKEFDNSEIERMKEQYADEVKERWGNTKAYEESVQKATNRSEEEEADYASGMKQLLEEFSKHLKEDPGSDEVQELVRRWQQLITKQYYECTDEILLGLGQMYVADERFLEFMDQYGKGTAQLVCDGIGIYCKKGR